MSTAPSRYLFPDIARGTAVLAMISYHFSWDLAWFGYVDWNVAGGTLWRAFAMCIAGSFLLLSGTGLYLAHEKTINWSGFWRREIKIIAAAIIVTIGTYFAFEDAYVRFGILHCIALSSVVALAFLRLHPGMILTCACLCFSLPFWASSAFFNHPALLWSGLSTHTPGSVDYVPLVPWLGCTLAGLATTRMVRENSHFFSSKEARFLNSAPINLLTRLGRNSLPIYLIHQPVLFALVWSANALGIEPSINLQPHISACVQACSGTHTHSDVCQSACSCAMETARSDKTLPALLNEPEDLQLQEHLQFVYQQCLHSAVTKGHNNNQPSADTPN